MALSDAELIEQSHKAILEWMMDPTVKQATLIGRLIELYEQRGLTFIVSFDLREDDYAEPPEPIRRPQLTVIEGGTT